ncbi:glycosyltransferase family 2 protein [Patescibacteria group bacterium]|nr:glycosyltransferase family 2 protein [Patescibacteria group bacterium]
MTNSKPTFSVVIPNYNGVQFLPSCLNSLKSAINHCHAAQFEIILVDNYSQDGSKEIFTQFDFPSKKIISLNQNFGFAGAVNRGIAASQSEFVIICNNDLTLNPNWFTLVVAEIKRTTDPSIASFFGLVLNQDGTQIESEGLQFFLKGKAFNINNGKKFSPSDYSRQKPHLIWGASASLVVYKREVLQKIGLFDPDFFAYEEDVDLAFRLHHHGFKTIFIPQAVSYHLGGGTSRQMGNFRHRMDAKNWIYLIAKNYPFKTILSHFPEIFTERLRNCSGLIKNTPLARIPFTLASTYIETLIHLPKMLHKRKMLN